MQQLNAFRLSTNKRFFLIKSVQKISLFLSLDFFFVSALTKITNIITEKLNGVQ